VIRTDRCSASFICSVVSVAMSMVLSIHLPHQLSGLGGCNLPRRSLFLFNSIFILVLHCPASADPLTHMCVLQSIAFTPALLGTQCCAALSATQGRSQKQYFEVRSSNARQLKARVEKLTNEEYCKKCSWKKKKNAPGEVWGFEMCVDVWHQCHAAGGPGI
jgi:hypothetical protein